MAPDELRDAFLQRKPMLLAFGRWVTERVITGVKELLGSEYSESFFKVHPQPRVKEVEGFMEKSTRAGKSYSDPLTDITDQVGTRFVVLLHSHSEIVNKAIEQVAEWDFTKAKDIEEIRLSDPHHFDYESYHWTVTPKVAIQIENVTVKPGVTCEIQVRTLLQHAYAELAHSTIYKPKSSAKPNLKRAMARGAALIETTDGVFQNVADEINKASGKLDEFIRAAADWFSNHVQKGNYSPSGTALRIVDAYVEDFAQRDWQEIENFLNGKSWLPNAIRENAAKPLFNDPVIVLVFWLVAELRHDIVKRWPFDISMLRPVFSKLGIAPDGCLD